MAAEIFQMRVIYTCKAARYKAFLAPRSELQPLQHRESPQHVLFFAEF